MAKYKYKHVHSKVLENAGIKVNHIYNIEIYKGWSPLTCRSNEVIICDLNDDNVLYEDSFNTEGDAIQFVAERFSVVKTPEISKKEETISILGTAYTIKFSTSAEDPGLKGCLGYCDNAEKNIVVKKIDPAYRNLSGMVKSQKETIRHEIIHAFLFESGLSGSSFEEWAMNEEMVDWIALQFEKMNKANIEAESIIDKIKTQEEIK